MRFPISAATKNFGYVATKKKRNVPRIGRSLTLVLYWKYSHSPSASLLPREVTGAGGQENCACYADIAVGSKGRQLGKFSQIVSRAKSAGSSLSCWKGGATRIGFRLAVAAVIDDHTLVFDRVADVLFYKRARIWKADVPR